MTATERPLELLGDQLRLQQLLASAHRHSCAPDQGYAMVTDCDIGGSRPRHQQHDGQKSMMQPLQGTWC